MVTKSRSFVLPATFTSTAEPTPAEVGASSVAAAIAVVATKVNRIVSLAAIGCSHAALVAPASCRTT